MEGCSTTTIARAKKLDEATVEKIHSLYNLYSAKELAKMFHCNINQVYHVKSEYSDIGYSLNTKINITPFQEQILLGGILGDGRLKKNGKNNVLYSECHALGEKEYLEWKFNNLGDLVSKTKIYGKNTNNKWSDAMEFTTKTTPSLIKFYLLSKDIDKVIPKMGELALIIDLLDDGWFLKNSNPKRFGSYCITAKQYTHKQRISLIRQWKTVCGIDFHEIGIKNTDLHSNVSESPKLARIILKYFPRDMDIISKKFGGTIDLLNV